MTIAFTRSDFKSPTWIKLKKQLQADLDVLRLQNDQPQPEEQTSRLRGRIAELNKILALETAPEEEA